MRPTKMGGLYDEEWGKVSGDIGIARIEARTPNRDEDYLMKKRKVRRFAENGKIF